MKFFTPELFNLLRNNYDGELDYLYRAATDACEQHVRSLEPVLPPEVFAVAAPFHVHDALIAQLRQSEVTSTIELVLRCGWTEIGYFDLAFTYGEADISDEHLGVLLDVARHAKDSSRFGGMDLHLHEVDVLKDGRFEHRLRFHEAGTAAIRCRTLRVKRTDRPDRDLPSFSRRYEVERFGASSRSE